MALHTQLTPLLRGVAVAYLGLFFPVVAQAASFDCGKAATSVEKVICATPELSKLDEELSEAYSAAREKAPDAAALKLQQFEWLKERNGCADADCVEMAYRSRLGELRPEQAEGRFLPVLVKDEQLCTAYKSYIEHEMAKQPSPRVICDKDFEKDFPEFQAVRWREISPAEHPDLAVQAYRYINFWPWDRKEVALMLSDRMYAGQLSEIKLNHSNNWWHMWSGEADIGNTGHKETLLRVEDGRCGEASATERPPRWRVPVMVVDSTGKGIDTSKSEWILGITVPTSASTRYWPSNIKPIPGLHSIMLTSFDIFSFSGKIFFDQWEDEGTILGTALADPRYALLAVYRIQQTKTTKVCQFKLKKKDD